MKKLYSLGIDYGTESGRAVLVDIHTGEEIAYHVTPYEHGVMDRTLPDGRELPGHGWALQHPLDYVEVLRRSVPEVLRMSGAAPEQVIGIGIDFTSCTMLPLDSAGNPLCVYETFRGEPNAYAKLWKHHAAQKEANLINEIAKQRGEAFIHRYGGKISSEWMLPKAWQILNESPAVFDAADYFMEAADWIVYRMTGQIKRNSGCAGYKACWSRSEGYPSKAFFKSLDPRLEHLAETKLRGSVVPLGTSAGGLTEEMASIMGLKPGTAVAVGNIDAHTAVPGVGAVRPGQLVMAMGTSLCHMLVSDKLIDVEGICGVVEDGIIPGLFAYEAGQPAVGDLFAWYVEQGVPAYVRSSADSEGLGIHDWLMRRASSYKPGKTGLLALDWWNGNRSTLIDADLSGLIVGLTLHTKPEEIYRALLEATAFGTLAVIEAFEAAGLEVSELYACGGLPQRNPLLMQIYADVTGREIKVAASNQTTAIGAAMFGAVAAGSARGGYDNIADAAARMALIQEESYKPIAAHADAYKELYREYVRLYDFFGRGGSDVMKVLHRLKSQ